MSEKLQKVLAHLGLGSRRELENWISESRVSINGKIAKLGERVTDTDVLRVDGKIIRWQAKAEFKRRVIIYNKPDGEICTRHDPEGRTTVFSHLPKLSQQRWVNIGRLDINTQGLILFTNDGELANRLMHPKYEIEREYAVRVYGEVSQDILQKLQEGVSLEDGIAKFDMIKDAGGEGKNHWYHVVLKEGRNREVRRLWESQGVEISRLIRVRFANITLPKGLSRGRWLDLLPVQIHQLAAQAQLPKSKVYQPKPLKPRAKRKVIKTRLS